MTICYRATGFTAALAAAILATSGLTGTPAAAGDYNEHSGLAIRGHDPVAYFVDAKPVQGKSELRHVHQGSTFHFASEANRAAFAADPAKYAPQYGGYCAFGAARGYKADIDPAAFSVVGGKLYLNYNAAVRKDWLQDPAGFISRADAKWPEVSRSTKVVR